ncbi:hypothetical protein BABINDRAFT_159391 [Babjeviella inositovora NRRL Y-12698]|uniref:Uncharacterized protein n=1 Tax=Babjeviella inositovora NRRL Y-12698 TaxID=984486 RepID=A0A1E3QYY6_9ASCO|nr:uncharacterized protein BABINDRAFT_159391 [Babjeviella inositovora NRRL Y-12698]ODQ82899.1 hypothetical protein BABINDRAFT_159391 [Babjeviella inositovora NRRL Y-12698]
MGIFKSKSTNKGSPLEVDSKLNIHTANVHDPILSAVQEAEPFAQAIETSNNRRVSYTQMHGNGQMADIFGGPIQQPDMSNPTRSRNERPMDTIRSFEYSITGDMSIRDQLETPRLGWGFHDDYPQFGTNPYGHSNGYNETHEQTGLNNYTTEQAVYSAPVVTGTEEKKKKKRGLFGRKK